MHIIHSFARLSRLPYPIWLLNISLSARLKSIFLQTTRVCARTVECVLRMLLVYKNPPVSDTHIGRFNALTCVGKTRDTAMGAAEHLFGIERMSMACPLRDNLRSTATQRHRCPHLTCGRKQNRNGCSHPGTAPRPHTLNVT